MLYVILAGSVNTVRADRQQAEIINSLLAAIVDSTDDAIISKNLDAHHYQLDQGCGTDPRQHPL